MQDFSTEPMPTMPPDEHEEDSPVQLNDDPTNPQLPTMPPDEHGSSPVQLNDDSAHPRPPSWLSRIRERPNRLLAAGLIALALLIAGGGFFYVLTNPGIGIPGLVVNHTSKQPTAGTHTPKASTTATPQSTSQTLPPVQTSSTPTQQPTLSPTPTSASPPIDSTKLSSQQLYTTVVSRAPTYSSDMSTQDSGQWEQKSGCSFANSAYNVSIPLIGNQTVCHANTFSVTNFAFQARMTIRTGSNNDGGGLVFRDASGAGYRFVIGVNGSYSLSGTSLKGTSSAINTGLNQTNILTVVAQGERIFLYINGQSIAYISDTFSSQGQIGLLATSFLLSVSVTFVNVKLWTF